MKLINESLTRSHSSLQYSLNVQDGHVQNLDGRAPFSPPISNPGIGDKSDQSLLRETNHGFCKDSGPFCLLSGCSSGSLRLFLRHVTERLDCSCLFRFKHPQPLLLFLCIDVLRRALRLFCKLAKEMWSFELLTWERAGLSRHLRPRPNRMPSLHARFHPSLP